MNLPKDFKEEWDKLEEEWERMKDRKNGDIPAIGISNIDVETLKADNPRITFEVSFVESVILKKVLNRAGEIYNNLIGLQPVEQVVLQTIEDTLFDQLKAICEKYTKKGEDKDGKH
jgi:hypothetical protein